MIKIIRALPPLKAEELLDFARFLEAQILTERLIQEEDAAEIEVDNERWNALLATDKAQTLLERLAEEVLTEHRLAKTKPMPMPMLFSPRSASFNRLDIVTG